MSKVKEREIIIAGEIMLSETPHPDENIRNKDWIAELFVKEFNGDAFIMQKSEVDKDIYKIKILDEEYNFSFDTTDSGGKIKSRKVGIPFASKTFREMMEKNGNVYVVNLYRPLIDNENVDVNNRVWLFVDPFVIYESDSFINETWTDSSRWYETNGILELINDGGTRINNKKTVFAALNESVKKIILDNNFRSKYYLMNQMNHDAREYLEDSKDRKTISRLRRTFRMLLLEKNVNNQVNSKVENEGLLVASHIHSVEDIKEDKTISNEEKLYQIGDVNNGLLIPVGLDKLFDKHYVTFDDEWNIIISSDVTLNELKEITGRNEIEGPWIEGKNDKSLQYLSKHRRKAFKKRGFQLDNLK